MKILVTGGCGFLGSWLVDKLIENGHDVVIIDDLSGGSMENANPKAKMWSDDCRDEKRIDHILKTEKPEIVYHLAANACENKAQFSPIEITSRNYDAFIKVLTPFIKYGGKRFVFTSSIAVYGALQTPFMEDVRPEPEDLYGISKYAIEESLKVMSKVHGFEYVITRPHNVYGPRQNLRDPYRNLVGIWMNALLRQEPYYIYGDGSMERCFSYIDDVVEALYKCGFEDVAGMTFNIGADKNYSLNEFELRFRQVTGGPEALHLPERAQEVKIAISDHSLAKKHLHYEDKIPLGLGLNKMWEWAQKEGPQELNYTEIEIDSPKLPQNWRKK